MPKLSQDDALLILSDSISKKIYHEDYARTVSLSTLYNQLITGEDNKSLLRRFSKREEDTLFKQRQDITQQITPSVANTIMKPFYKVGRTNSINKKIDFKNSQEQAYEVKLEKIGVAIKEYNGNLTLDEFLEDNLVDLEFTDPNAFVITEYDAPLTGKQGELLEDVKPRPFIAYCKEAINFFYENNILQWLIVKLPFIYTDDKGNSKTYYSYTLYAPEFAYKFNQIEANNHRGNEGEFTQIITSEGERTIYRVSSTELYEVSFYDHKSSVIPAIRVGYKRDLVTKGRTCVSPLHPAIPYFMKTVKTVSEMDLTMCLHAFPQKYQYVPQCNGTDDEPCKGGRLLSGGECTKCNGLGYIIHTTAQDAIILPLPRDKEDMKDLSQMAHYIYPPIDLLNFQDEYIKSLTTDAKKAIFVDDLYSKSQTSGDKTAYEVSVSVDSVYDTLFAFAQKFSEIYKYQVIVMSNYLDITDIIVEHKFPKDFKFKTVTDLLNELDIANRSGAPGYVRDAISRDIAYQQFIDKPQELKKIGVKEMFYPFPGKSPTEVIYIISNNKTTKDNEILWANFDSIFLALEQESLSTNVYFYDMEYMKQKSLVDKKVQELALLIESESPLPAITFGDAGTGSNIDGGGAAFELGKVPLAIQQLALARTRAIEANDTALQKQIGDKIDELLNNI